MGAAVQGEGQEQLSRHFFQQQHCWEQALPGQAKSAFRKREMKREEVTLNSSCFSRAAYITASWQGRAGPRAGASSTSPQPHCSTEFFNF